MRRGVVLDSRKRGANPFWGTAGCQPAFAAACREHLASNGMKTAFIARGGRSIRTGQAGSLRSPSNRQKPRTTGSASHYSYPREMRV